MNKLTLIFIVGALICCTNRNYRIDNTTLNKLVDMEISNISKTLMDLDTVKNSSEWVEGDRRFFSLWLEGAKNEQKGDYKTAIKFYTEASKVSRFEMSSYDIKLPLGRALIQNGNFAKASVVLNEFKEEANYDINNEDAEWALTEEGKDSVREKIKFCDILLEMIKSKN